MIWRSGDNPQPVTAEDITEFMQIADIAISTEVYNAQAIADLAILGLTLLNTGEMYETENE